MDFRRTLGSIGGFVRRAVTGPFNLLRGVLPVTGGDPPIRGTRELLEAYESLPWLRSVAERVGTSVGCTEWQLFTASDAKGPAPAPQSKGQDELYLPLPEAMAADVVAAVKAIVQARVSRALGRPAAGAVRRARIQAAYLGARTEALQQLADAGQLESTEDHPFLDVIDNPNPMMSRLGLLKITNVHLDLVGDSFWVMDRSAAGLPVGFWPVPPNWVWEYPTADKPSYRIAWKSWQVTVPESEVLWFHDPSPANPYTRGSGIGWSLGDELQVDEYAAKMAAALFFNRARPDFIVMGGEASSETEMKRLQRDWLNQLQGFWRAYKPYFLTGKVDIHEFTANPGEAFAYPNLRKTQRDIVLQTWGAPPEIFGINEKGNLARVAYEAAEYMYDKYVVVPRQERLRQVLQRFVMREYGEAWILHYVPAASPDKEHELNVMKAAPWAFERDEWRARAGHRAAAKGGRVVMVPLNSYATEDLLDAAARPQSGRTSDGRRAEDAKQPAAEETTSDTSAAAADAGS